MALINCPECNHQISDSAEVCPNCGYPIKDYFIQLEKQKQKEEELRKKEKDKKLQEKKKKIEFNELRTEMEAELKKIDYLPPPTKPPKRVKIGETLISLLFIILPLILFGLYKLIKSSPNYIYSDGLFFLAIILFLAFIVSLIPCAISFFSLASGNESNQEYTEKFYNFGEWKKKEKAKIESKYEQYAENMVKYGQRTKPNSEKIIVKNTARNDEPVKCPRCGSTQITTGQRGYSLFWGFLGSNKSVNRCGRCGHSWEPHIH